MSRALDKRLVKLEMAAGLAGEFIPVFCKDDAGFEAALADKIRWGLCKPEDRSRCLPYYHEQFATLQEERAAAMVDWFEGRTPGYQGPAFGIHEEWVGVLR